MTTQHFLERVDQSSPRVDRAANVIRGVKILGLKSKNGREYSQSAVAAAAGLYEGSKVNVNHRSDPRKGAMLEDRFGSLHRVSLASDGGLIGDLHYNPKHPMAEQVLWDAENAPHRLGLSHNIEGKATSRGGKTIVEKITRVHSVDLVADPATTSGLYESRGTGYIRPTPIVRSGEQLARVLTGERHVERGEQLVECHRFVKTLFEATAEDPTAAVEKLNRAIGDVMNSAASPDVKLRKVQALIDQWLSDNGTDTSDAVDPVTKASRQVVAAAKAEIANMRRADPAHAAVGKAYERSQAVRHHHDD